MQNGAEQFGGAVGVDAAVVDFAFGADNLRAAYGALLRHNELASAAGMIFVVDDLRDFRDHVAATLDLHPVADLYSQALDLIHVVQRGIADGCTADQYGRQHRDRSQFSRAAHLNPDIFQLSDAGTSRVFVGDCPARGFAGESKFILQAGAVDFYHDAV